MSYPKSETSKYRHITAQYCQGSPGVDIGSAGDPVVPHAIQIDLDTPYGNPMGPGPIHIRGDGACNLDWWFRSDSLSFVYSSHLLEDFDLPMQVILVRRWMRTIKPGGHLVILMPDAERWKRRLAEGQPPNDAHQHEGSPGELSRIISELFLPQHIWKVLMDECPDPDDYGIVFVARRLA